MVDYSERLIKKTVAYFKKNHNLDISPETASEYLDNLSWLFLALAKDKDVKKINTEDYHEGN